MRIRGMLGRRIGRNDPPPTDRSLTMEYRVEAAAAPDEETVSLICGGCSPREFTEQSAPRLPLYGGPRDGMAVMDMCCGMDRTRRHVAPLVRAPRRRLCRGDGRKGALARQRRPQRRVPHPRRALAEWLCRRHARPGLLRACVPAHAERDAKVVRRRGAPSLRPGGPFFSQLPRAEFCADAECALTEGEIRALLAGFASAGGPVDEGGQYWLARAAKSV